MELQELILHLILGGFLGIIGQGIRAIIGLKKMNDDKQMNADAEPFNPTRFWISIFIGFIAGCLAVVVERTTVPEINHDAKEILMIIAAGYSGVDFIEGVIIKYIPKPVIPVKGSQSDLGK